MAAWTRSAFDRGLDEAMMGTGAGRRHELHHDFGRLSQQSTREGLRGASETPSAAFDGLVRLPMGASAPRVPLPPGQLFPRASDRRCSRISSGPSCSFSKVRPSSASKFSPSPAARTLPAIGRQLRARSRRRISVEAGPPHSILSRFHGVSFRTLMSAPQRPPGIVRGR